MGEPMKPLPAGAVVKTLSSGTVSMIKCSQVITSPWSAVKELVENSLDAGATNLEVKLEDYGMDKIEVRDNGSGVEVEQVEKMVAAHTTSKINDFGDMDGLTSYGFRGEALHSLCSLSSLSVVTRTSRQPTASSYSFDQKGNVTNCSPLAARQGTCVTATKLFSNLPVRKNYYKDLARKKEEMKKIERTVQGFSIIHSNARVSLHHNKAQIFQKAAQGDLLKSVGAVLGQVVVSKMELIEELVLDGVNITAVLPKKGSLSDLGRTNVDKTFTFVNKRLVELKDVERTLKTVFSKAAKFENEKYPVAVINIEVSGEELAKLDVNLEPNKQKVGLGCRQVILQGLELMMNRLYGLKVLDSGEGEGHNDTYGAQLGKEENSEVEDQTFVKPQVETDIKLASKDTRTRAIDPDSGFTVVGKNINPIMKDQNQSPIDFSPDIASTFSEKIHFENNLTKTESDSEKEELAESESIKKESTFNASDFDDPFEEENVVPNSSSMFNICDEIPNIEVDEEKRDYDVYKKTLFDTPGVDAVYLNRLKAGEEEVEADLDENFELEEDDSPDKRPKNPFIDYECGVGNDEKENEDSYKDLIEEEDAFAQGRLVTSGGDPLQPVGLLQPKRSFSLFPPRDFSSSPESPLSKNGSFSLLPPLKNVLPRNFSSNTESPLPKMKTIAAPIKRKYDADESVTRIDEFLKRSKIKKGPIGDQTLANLAIPLGTPRIAVNKRKIARKVTNVKMDKGQCRQELLDRNKVINDSDVLVGRVDFEGCQGWLFFEGGEVKAVNHFRMQEVALYDQLAGGHVLINTKLPEPVVLYPGGSLDSDLARLLIGLQSRGCPARVTDKRLVLNGFDIVIYRTQEVASAWRQETQNDGDVKIKLEGKSSVIKFYGVSDLIEVLQTIQKTPGVSVKESRPLRVKEFLRNESLRMVRQLPTGADKDEVAGLLTYRHRQSVSTCIHSKTIVSTIHAISGHRSSSPDSE